MRAFLFLLGLAAATPAFAQQQTAPATPGPQRPPQPAANIIVEPVAMMIAGFDRDGDGKVTRAEFDAGLAASFKAADTGNRGSLSYIGFSDWAQTWLGHRDALPGAYEVDSDGDNRITLTELRARFDLYWTRFDADKDGVILRSELIQVRAAPMIMERGKRRRDPALREPQ